MTSTTDRPKAKPDPYGMLRLRYAKGIKDDLTGQILPDEFVTAGMQPKLGYFKSKGVWEVVPIYEWKGADIDEMGLHEQERS